jgi:Flp pilus assembly pilin Flp
MVPLGQWLSICHCPKDPAGGRNKDENGQDLIEYAPLVALTAFAATSGMRTLSTAISTAFNHMGTKLGTYIT